MSFEPGVVVADKYRIVRMIGRGGVGEVYEGENLRIRRKVAIKTLKSEFVAKADIVQRFEREAQAAGRIGSAHIVEVLDLGDLPDGSRFLVMEYLEGQTLSKHIRTVGRMTPLDAAQIIVQLLEGLAGAHAAGIVHRDLKPANIYLLPKNGELFVKILDFGVSKFNTLASDELSMTKTGVVVGTPYYMAPEQAKGARSVDGRADLYAVGVIAYECVTGQVPFSAQTFNELLFKIVLEAPPPIEQFVPDVDPAFAALVRKAMNREPNMRFQSAGEFLDALAGWLQRASGGRLGGDLAQTTAFGDGGGSTMILDVSGRPVGPPMAPPHPAVPGVPHPGGPHPGSPAHGSIPPMAPAGAVHGVAPGYGPAPAMGAPGPMGGGPSWTNEVAPPPARSKTVPIVIASAVGFLVLGIATLLLVRSGGDDGASDLPAGETASAATVAPAAPPVTGEPSAARDAPPAPPVEDPADRPSAVVTAAPASPPTGTPATAPPAPRPPSTGAAAAPRPPATSPRPPASGAPRPPSGGKPPAGRPISGDL